MRKQHRAEMRRILGRMGSAAALMILAALAACTGGSGSSGFDSLENSAISEALTQQRCVESDGLLICPSDSDLTPRTSATPTPTATGAEHDRLTPTASATAGGTDFTPTPPMPASTSTPRATDTATRTPTPSPEIVIRIDTDVSDVESIDCQPAAQDRCMFVFSFSAQGFPPGTEYRVAVRTGSGAWTIHASTPTGPANAPNYETDVTLATEVASGSDAEAQFAVLVFLQPAGVVPSEVDHLGDTGADAAFVTSPVVVSSP